jgi:NitT/TauT family transport system permease protein
MADRGQLEEIPSYGAEADPAAHAASPVDMSSLTSLPGVRGAAEVATLIAVALGVFFGLEAALVISDTPEFVFPRPTAVVATLFTDFTTLYLPPLLATLKSFGAGFLIGSTIGLLLAALITQRPFVEKIIAPYIIVMVTTPMIALVPFLMLQFGFGLTPRVIAVALASGPMVMINAATGFRRTDAAMIALARSYGASTFQIFRRIRFPLALPMIIVGYMVGAIFGLLTAVGAEMVGGGLGLGNRLVYFSSLVRIPQFGATLLIVAGLGVSLYVLFFLIGKRWASWES